VQLPQRGGNPNQRVRRRQRYSLHKIGDGDPILGAGIPDTGRQACIGRRLHAGEVTCHIAGAGIDPQQVCRSSHDKRKARFDPGRSVRSWMSSNSLTPKVSFRPRVTAALFSCGIISLDITQVSDCRPVLSLASLHLYLACFLRVRLAVGGPVILEAGGSCCPSLRGRGYNLIYESSRFCAIRGRGVR